MFALALSLLLIGLAVGWFFSCPGDSGVCQITRSFSIGWGIFGFICLAMSIFALVEDRINATNARASDPSSDASSEGR